MTVKIQVVPTRNENLVGFKLETPLLPPGTGLSYSTPGLAQGNPLARALFEIPGVVGVWILGDEIQVTKEASVRWSRIQSKVIETIRKNVNSTS